MFSSEGWWWDYRGELDIFENRLSNSLPMSQKFMLKIPQVGIKICI